MTGNGDGVLVRSAAKGDGEGMARAWVDAARTYTELDPELFAVPAAEGLAESMEAWIAEAAGQQERLLVAEIGGQVVGLVSAAVEPPAADPETQLVRDVRLNRLVVGALVVEEAYRRRGVGTQLMRAAEEWGRTRGARVALLDTWGESQYSVPFYERLGYVRHSIRFRKRLDRS